MLLLEGINHVESKFYLLDSLIDQISANIDSTIQESLQSKAICKKLYNTCGDKAFLVPESLSLPIMNPKTCQVDKKLLYKSYLEALKYAGVKTGYRDAVSKAKDLLQEVDGEDIYVQINGVDSQFDIITLLEILGHSNLSD